MTPKEAYGIFLMMCAYDPLMFARAVASQKEYPDELRKYAQDFIDDPKAFLNLVV